jgi:hypothetical protein
MSLGQGFGQLVTSSPNGFHAACDRLNVLLENEEAAEEIVKMAPRLYSGGLGAMESGNNKKWEEELKAVMFILYCYTESEVKPEDKEIASVLDLNTFLSRTSIAYIVRCLGSVRVIEDTIAATSGSETPVEVMSRKLSNYGRVTNLQWKLGVALASSKCKMLSSPYVALSFDTMTSDGVTRKETLEMTYQEFSDFFTKLTEVDAAMSR